VSTVLVTGAAGFIGRRLCASLRRDFTVRALLRRDGDGPWHQSFTLDLGRDDIPVEAVAGVDTIYHLAARTHAISAVNDEPEYVRVNVDGTRDLLERAGERGVRRMVFMSSVKAMGEGSGVVMDETTPPDPTSAYGQTKLAAERLVLNGNLVPEGVVLRPALIYGPGVKGNLAAMIAAIDAGRFPPPPQVSNQRSMVHVDDVVAATALAGKAVNAAGETFIVSDGEPYSTRRIYELICLSLGRDVPRWSVPLPVLRSLAIAGDALSAVLRRRAPFDSDAYGKLFGSACYDGSRIRRALDFKPLWDLERALPAIVEAWRSHH
jgi:nucleoside-diphosphate-sugar epimerase